MKIYDIFIMLGCLVLLGGCGGTPYPVKQMYSARCPARHLSFLTDEKIALSGGGYDDENLESEEER